MIFIFLLSLYSFPKVCEIDIFIGPATNYSYRYEYIYERLCACTCEKHTEKEKNLLNLFKGDGLFILVS